MRIKRLHIMPLALLLALSLATSVAYAQTASIGGYCIDYEQAIGGLNMIAVVTFLASGALLLANYIFHLTDRLQLTLLSGRMGSFDIVGFIVVILIGIAIFFAILRASVVNVDGCATIDDALPEALRNIFMSVIRRTTGGP